MRYLISALAAAALATSVSAQDLPKPSNEPSDFLQSPPQPSRIRGPFKLTMTGDLLYSFPAADKDDPELQKVLALIRTGDVTIGNREGMFFDLKTFTGTGLGNGMLWSSAEIGPDMKKMGYDLLSMANNHSTDWGTEGLIESERLLDKEGIVHAGSGRTMREALAPGIVNTPKGSVGLISTASTFRLNAGANDAFGDIPARAGISRLRTRTINTVTPDQFARLHALATELSSPRAPAPAPDAQEIVLRDAIYRIGDRVGVSYEMDLYDHAALLKAVRDAKEKADLVVFTIHAHESPTGMDDDNPEPPDFLVRLFHDAVDAGADVILGGGPHSLRGIEIYKGRPIIYGIGTFFINGQIKAMQETAFQAWPEPSRPALPPVAKDPVPRQGGNPKSWYDGMVVETHYDSPGRLREVRLYPLDLGNTPDRTRRGIPHFADPENAKRILADLQQFSAPFGTKIVVDGSVGRILLP